MIVRIAWRALLRNKTRSFLTMLGIIIGVAAVITMLALGTGAQSKVTSSIASMGTNTITVSAGSVTKGGVRTGAFGSTALTVDDCIALKEGVSELTAVSPFTQNTAQVIYQEQNWATAIVGISPDYQSIKNWVVTNGRFITDEDVRGCQKVCVLGDTVVKELFANTDPIGQSVRVGRTPMKVVGVLQAKGEASFGPSQDDTVLVPYTTAMRRLFNITNVRNIQCSAVSEAKVDVAVNAISDILRQRHRLSEKDDDDFTVRTQAELAQMMSESTQTFTYLLGGIASVSLMVGGIGIMNIMLVSVTERIREIGIRMALGARASDILRQFLVEAMMLSVMGGAIGVACAWGMTIAGSRMFQMTMTISSSSVMLAFLFSAGVGVFFGLYPAVSASQMDPIDALRHE
ncbi:MAG: ABC transporter permease [bacterium]|nr:ABC transporter permease [bacterium]